MRYLMFLAPFVILWLLAVELRLVPPLAARTLVRIRDGRTNVEKGELKASASEHISSLLREAGVQKGFIAVTSPPRVYFSAGIPSEVHQA
jgi:hypothetical protein